MIFVTIGTMMPFDRLIETVDAWAAENQQHEFLAQIGNGTYEPKNMTWVRRLSQVEYAQKVDEADILVTHVGMGSIITAGRFGVPVAMMPRRENLGEVNTDHQLASAKWLKKKKGIFLAEKEDQLPDAIERALQSKSDSIDKFSKYADQAFTDRLKQAISELG